MTKSQKWGLIIFFLREVEKRQEIFDLRNKVGLGRRDIKTIKNSTLIEDFS